MNCHNCGNQINQDSGFCSECGADINETSNDLAKNSQESTTVTVSAFGTKPVLVGQLNEILGKSMKWFNFFVKFVIPLWVIWELLSALSQTRPTVIASYDGDLFKFLLDQETGIYNSISLFTFAASIIILIAAQMPLKAYKRRGYTLIIVYFTFCLMMPLILNSIQHQTPGSSGLIARSFPNMIICIMNLIYFVKRKHIFTN